MARHFRHCSDLEALVGQEVAASEWMEVGQERRTSPPSSASG